MPPGWNAIKAVLVAAAFTTEQLESLCQTAFGASLTGITQSTDPEQQAEDVVTFAVRHDLVRELSSLAIRLSSDRPAVQNMLLSDDMVSDGQANELARQTMRMDRIAEQTQQILAELAAMRQWQATADARLHAIEAAMPGRRSAEPLSLGDRAIVLLMGLMVLVLLSVGLYFATVAR